MAKIEKSIKDSKSKDTKRTICYLKSKANFIIPIQCNNQTLFIQPFGQVKVVKEQTTFDKTMGKYLTFIKY